MPKYYAGIGSRNTPKEILHIMCQLGYVMAENSYVLRSGGAKGADTYFQMGCQEWCKDNSVDFSERQEIFLPWDGFNDLSPKGNNGITLENHWLALEITHDTHPNANRLTNTQMQLMMRNVSQVYGNNQVDSEFIVCWTPDAATDKTSINTGGTGQAIRLANEADIPVINLNNKKHLKTVLKWIEE